MKVNFLIIGTQKGGTTALAKFLSSHPDIYMAPRKEVHYFDNEDYFAKAPDYEQYHAYFPDYNGEPLIGEATPIYMYLERFMRRIHDYNPDMKLIVLLRNPVERAYSQFTMMKDKGLEPLPFGLALWLERARLFKDRNNLAKSSSRRRHSYVDRGRYVRQMKDLATLFPPEQVLTIKSEDLSRNHFETLAKLFQFLGVDPEHSIPPEQIHVGQYKAPMGNRERRYLERQFKDEIRELENLLNWDLTTWKTSPGRPS